MNQSLTNSFYIDAIVNYLKILGYEFENWDKEWIHTVLVTSCPPRYNLLLWILRQLGFKKLCIKSSSSEQLNQILEELSSVGCCKLSDSGLVEATACPILQLKFWKKLLEFVIKLKNDGGQSSSIDGGNDQLLDKLLHSPYYNCTIQDEEFTLLPADLRTEYKTWSHQEAESFRAQFTPLPKQLEAQKDLQAELKVYAGEADVMEDVCDCVSAVTKQNLALTSMHNLYMASWCKISDHVFLNLPETGHFVDVNQKELSSFLKVLSLSERVKLQSEEIENQTANLVTEGKHLTSASVLDDIALQSEI